MVGPSSSCSFFVSVFISCTASSWAFASDIALSACSFSSLIVRLSSSKRRAFNFSCASIGDSVTRRRGASEEYSRDNGLESRRLCSTTNDVRQSSREIATIPLVLQEEDGELLALCPHLVLFLVVGGGSGDR